MKRQGPWPALPWRYRTAREVLGDEKWAEVTARLKREAERRQKARAEAAARRRPSP